MTLDPLISFASDRQDVVLWRALGRVPDVRYLDATRSGQRGRSLLDGLRERGWVPLERVEDAAAGPLHVLVVEDDGEGPGGLLESAPWVVVRHVRDTEPTTSSPWLDALVAAGYRPCLFDGVTQFFVAPDHAAELGRLLSFPACSRDAFVDHDTETLRAARLALISDVFRWRAVALEGWARDRDLHGGGRRGSAESGPGQREIDAIHATLSWRVTAPLRKLRGLARR